jgi:hypothetical protein
MLATLGMLLAGLGASDAEWKPLTAGVEHRTFALALGDGKEASVLQVVRVDANLAPLDFGLASQAPDGATRSCAAWAKERDYVVAINAGMYGTDDKTNVGYLRHGKHENNPRWNDAYQSVLVFGPKEKGLPPVQILDRDSGGSELLAKRYHSVVQNLRLLKGDGAGVWSANGRRWSEAALGIDGQGRLLFLFLRTPMQMVDFNRLLVSLPLDLRRAMHLDGGPPASLSVRAEGLTLDLSGTYESGLFERGENARQWRLPNVLGVKRLARHARDGAVRLGSGTGD